MGALPSDLAVTISPSAQNVSYTASSVIPLITGSFLKRDTGDELAIEIQDIPKEIDLLFDGTGSTIAWQASGPTGLVSADAHLTPGHPGWHARVRRVGRHHRDPRSSGTRRGPTATCSSRRRRPASAASTRR